MGVRKYHNKYRAYIVDSNGRTWQEYFDTEKAANDFVSKLRPKRPQNSKTTKRASAKHQDLPVGLEQRTVKKQLIDGGERIYKIIKATAVIDGKLKSLERAYGKKRSRDDAIRLCLNWRNCILK